MFVVIYIDYRIEYGKSQKDLDRTFLLCYYKSYTNSENTTFGNLQMPGINFYNYINELENIYVQRFSILAVEKNVGSKLKEMFCNVPFDHPCKIFDSVSIKTIYKI